MEEESWLYLGLCKQRWVYILSSENVPVFTFNRQFTEKKSASQLKHLFLYLGSKILPPGLLFWIGCWVGPKYLWNIICLKPIKENHPHI